MKKRLAAILAAIACTGGLLVATTALAPPASAATTKTCTSAFATYGGGNVRMCVAAEYVMTAAGPVRTVGGRITLEPVPGTGTPNIDSYPAVSILDQKVRGCINGTGYGSCVWDGTAGSGWSNASNLLYSYNVMLPPGFYTGNLDRKGTAVRASYAVEMVLHRNNATDVHIYLAVMYGQGGLMARACQAYYEPPLGSGNLFAC